MQACFITLMLHRCRCDTIWCSAQGMGPGRGDGERGQGYRKLWQQVYTACISHTAVSSQTAAGLLHAVSQVEGLQLKHEKML